MRRQRRRQFPVIFLLGLVVAVAVGWLTVAGLGMGTDSARSTDSAVAATTARPTPSRGLAVAGDWGRRASSTADDSAPPTIVDFASLDPNAIYDRPFAARAAVEVDPAAPVMVVFSVPMNPSTFDPGQVRIEIGHVDLPIRELAWRSPTELVIHAARPLPPGGLVKFAVLGPLRSRAGTTTGDPGEVMGEFVCRLRHQRSLMATAGDFTGTGRVDLVVGGPSRPAGLWENAESVPQPSGFLADAMAGVVALTTADLAGDPRPDVAVVRAASESSRRFDVAIFVAERGAEGFREISIPLENSATAVTTRHFAPPTALLTGDFTGNGWADLVVVDPFGRHLLIENRRGREFVVRPMLDRTTAADAAPPAGLPRNWRPTAMITAAVVADLDGDSFADLIVADAAGQLTAWINDRRGGFSAVAIMDRLGLVTALAAGDVNRNGHVDLVVGQAGQADELLLRESAHPLRFWRMPMGLSDDFSQTRALILCDVNADGHLDVVAVASDVPGVRVSLNDRFGGFAPPVYVAGAGKAPGGHDGDDDDDDGGLEFHLRTAGSAPDSASAADATVGGAPSDARLDGLCFLVGADFDGDGCNDIFATTDRGDAFFLLTSNGLFRAPPAVFGSLDFERLDDWLPRPKGPIRAAAAGDITRNGRPDLVVGIEGGGVEIWTAVSAGGFVAADFLPDLLGAHVLLLDVNRDGYLDLVDVDLRPDARPGEMREDARLPLIRVAYNGGERNGRPGVRGQFGDPIPWLTWPILEPARSVVVADFNADGQLDVFFGLAVGAVLLLSADIDTGFVEVVLPAELADPSRSAPILGAVAADFDGDGWLDLGIATGSRATGEPAPNWWLRNLGNGRFDLLEIPNSAHEAVAMAAGDLDANGLPDLVWLSPESGTLEIRLRRRGSMGWDAYSLPVHRYFDDTMGVIMLDLDRDGTPDAVITGIRQGSGWQEIWRSDGYGQLLDDANGGEALRDAAGPAKWRPLVAADLTGDRTPELLLIDDAGIPHLLRVTMH